MAFPTVQARASSSHSTNVTSHTVSLASGTASGDLILVEFVCDEAPTITPPAGYTTINNAANGVDVSLCTLYRVADGSEGTTITITTSTAQMSAHRAWLIRGHSATTNPPQMAAINTSFNVPDPASLTPTGGAKDYLWIVMSGWAAVDASNPTITAFPASYGNTLSLGSGGADPVLLGCTERSLNAASEDPGAYTLDNSAKGRHQTVAVHPGVEGGGGADVTPPGAPTLTATAHTAGARVDLSAQMPVDADVSQYEIRSLTTGYPLSDRTDGTVIVSPTGTTPSAVVTFSHTTLTNSTRYYYRVFVKDTTGNWNTGTTATAVAATPSTFLQRYTSSLATIPDGVTPTGNNPVVEFQLATTDFEAGKVAHFRCRFGNDNATPPTQSLTDYVSSTGGSVFRYEDPAASGTFLDVPTSGLPTTFQARKLRVYTSETGSSRWFSFRVEQ